MQRDTADQLDVIVALMDCPVGRFTNGSEGFRQQFIKGSEFILLLVFLDMSDSAIFSLLPSVDGRRTAARPLCKVSTAT